MSAAASFTIPVAASAAMNWRCRAGPIELRRICLCGTGANDSSGSSPAGGAPSRFAMYEGRVRAREGDAAATPEARGGSFGGRMSGPLG